LYCWWVSLWFQKPVSFNNFRYTYLKGGGKEAMLGDTDVYRQISDDEFIMLIVLMPNLNGF
jgi:hypothetical protein